MPKTTARRATTQQLPEELANALQQLERYQQQQDRTNTKRRTKSRFAAQGPRWATGANAQAGKPRGKAQRGTTGQAGQMVGSVWEQERRMMIRERNRLRRWPWIPAAGTVGLGLAAQGATLLYGLTGVPVQTTAAVIAGIPAATALVVGVKAAFPSPTRRGPGGQTQPEHRRWLPEIAAAGTSSALVVYWIALAGVSWWVVLVVLVGTIALGSRWWKAHPIGPGVARLEPPRPAPEPEAARETPATAAPERDEFTISWRHNIGNKNGGKLANSRLTNRQVTDHTVTYDVELWKGQHNYQFAATQVASIASGLGLGIEQVIVEPPRKNSLGRRPMDRARLTIITRDAVSGTRYYTGPTVEVSDNGRAAVITGLARYRDGKGEARISMWNKHGMIPTAIFGGTGGGKSAAANELTCGALSTGLLNLIYIDFKGNSSQALRNRARIAVIGEDAGVQAGRLMRILIAARIGDNPADKLFPTPDRPGWMVLIDEITIGLKASQKFAMFVENGVTTVRSLGMWMVAMSQNMHTSAWHSDRARSAFIKQAISFYISSKSGSDLVHGLTYDPANLPTFDEDEAGAGEEGQPIPGWAVHARTDRSNVPCLWDWLPDDDEDLAEEPPYRVSAAFDAFFNQPDIHPAEYQALVKFLGPPVNGRWVIGQGGTHQFPAENTLSPAGSRPRRTTGFSGKPLNPDGGSTGPAEDNDTHRRVFEVIEGGTRKPGEIVAALSGTISRATVYRAFEALIADNRIHRDANNEYRTGPAPAGA